MSTLKWLMNKLDVISTDINSEIEIERNEACTDWEAHILIFTQSQKTVKIKYVHSLSISISVIFVNCKLFNFVYKTHSTRFIVPQWSKWNWPVVLCAIDSCFRAQGIRNGAQWTSSTKKDCRRREKNFGDKNKIITVKKKGTMETQIHTKN